MTGVIIAAGGRDKKMWRVLPELLRRNLPAVFADELPQPAAGEPAKLVLCDPEGAKSLRPDRAIIICKDADSLPDEYPEEGDSIAVVDSSNPRTVEGVSTTRLPAITCGLSPRDTLTLSSYDEDSAVLGVQRAITCFDGSVAEPQEIPLRLSGPIDSFTLMAASSVFVMTGNTAHLKDAVF